ncbi:MAG: CNNM domain-containing protein [Kiritimatiellales bacterium]|nr:CNNM domain-containing protein [Kiritimatiellales bacterium]
MTTVLQLLAVFLCVTGEAFFSGMETGIVSIRRLRLRHRLRQGDRAARSLAYFREEPDRLLGTTLVGTNLCVVVASVLWANMAGRLWGVGGQAAATVALTVILLVFGEFIPKAWFRARPYVRSARFVRPLRLAWIVFRPFGLAMTWLAGLVLPGESSGKQDLRTLANRDEFKLLASEGEQHGILTTEEREMIHRTVELTDRTARAIMTPLDRIASASSNGTLQAFLDMAREKDFSRFPVRDPQTGRFVGIVAVLNVLAIADRDERALNKATVTPVFMPADTPADEIMPILRLAHQSMGLVTDAADDVIGLVTTDDVLKQIVHDA